MFMFDYIGLAYMAYLNFRADFFRIQEVLNIGISVQNQTDALYR